MSETEMVEIIDKIDCKECGAEIDYPIYSDSFCHNCDKEEDSAESVFASRFYIEEKLDKIIKEAQRLKARMKGLPENIADQSKSFVEDIQLGTKWIKDNAESANREAHKKEVIWQ